MSNQRISCLIRFLEKYLKMAEGTESIQQLTDNDIFHDIDLCQEICLMMRVTQNNGNSLPIFSFTERQIVGKYKQFTGLEPIVLTLMGPHYMLLEFDKKADVISSSQKIHSSKTWDSMRLNISCIMSPQKSKLLEIFNSSQEKKKEKLELQRRKRFFRKRRFTMKRN